MSEKKKKIMIISIVLGILTAILIVGGIIAREIYSYYDKKDYHEVRSYNIPNDYIEDFGNVSLPNRWDIKKQENWYVLYDNKTNKILAYQIYKGYEILKDNNYIWNEYIENPIVNYYNYADIYFDSTLTENNNASYGIYDNLMKITFYKYKELIRYSMSFLAVDVIDFYKFEWMTNTFNN